MVTPSSRGLMGVSPTSARGNCGAKGFVQLVDGEIAMKVGVEFADRRAVTHAETAIDDLNRQFAICRRSAVDNAPYILKVLHQPLRAHDIAGHAMAEEHEVVAARRGTKVGIEGQEPVDAASGRAEMVGDDLRGLERDPSEMLVDLLQRREDQLLRFLEIAVVKMGEDPPDFVEVDLVGTVPIFVQATTTFGIWAGDDRRHFFQFSPR
jgi:hypothetical protein